MTKPKPTRPAAYIRAAPESGARALSRRRQFIGQAAARRGWPAPKVYAERQATGPQGGNRPALASLAAAITAGHHDAVIINGAIRDTPAYLMDFLLHCTRHGVTVTIDGPAEAAGSFVMRPPAGSRHLPPFPLPGAAAAVLASAGLEALTSQFPAWLIWTDSHGWHARRRGGYVQGYRPGTPVFCVHARSAAQLAAQLCWQHATETHTPAGCTTG